MHRSCWLCRWCGLDRLHRGSRFRWESTDWLRLWFWFGLWFHILLLFIILIIVLGGRRSRRLDGRRRR